MDLPELPPLSEKEEGEGVIRFEYVNTLWGWYWIVICDAE